MMTMMERTGMGMPGMMSPTSLGLQGLGAPTTLPGTGNWLMVPRCTYKIERSQGGLKITCTCDEELACTTLQNLCRSLAGGLCSCCILQNGMVVCTCNLTLGACKCENVKNGVCFTCTSGDKACGEMIGAICDCLATMVKSGCTCCMFISGTPVCCGASS